MSTPSQSPARWPPEGVLFTLAGTITLVATALGAFVSKWFLLLAVVRRGRPMALRAVRRLPSVNCAASHLPAALGYLLQPTDNREPASTPPAREEVTV